jgi:hypothetical protein
MTFIPVKTFDENGEFKVIKKRRKILKEGEVQEDGSIKGKAEVKLEYGTLTRENLNTDVGNLAAAEVLALEEFEIFWGMGTPPLNHVDPESHLAHRISMAAARILVTHSKRGRGNTVDLSPHQCGTRSTRRGTRSRQSSNTTNLSTTWSTFKSHISLTGR